MQKEKKQYGFLTVLAMIVGICVGSGIFFKTSSILEATGGNVALGVLIFILGAISIIFGSLTLAQLALHSNKDGGLIAYFEDFVGRKAAAGVGWFQAFVYLPTITVIVGWVTGIYTLELFPFLVNTERKLLLEIVIGLCYIVFFGVLNLISLRAGAFFQSSVMIIKLIPLLLIAGVGLCLGSPNATLSQTFFSSGTLDSSRGWLMAIVPMAYAYDGRIVATSLGNQVKNPQTTMRKALIIGPLLVLAVYLLYYLGMVNLLGVDQILIDGKNAVYTAGIKIFGNNGGKMILVSVLVSLLGVINGLSIALLRLPHILAKKGMLPQVFLSSLPDQDDTTIPFKIILVSMISIALWTGIHYIVMKYDLFAGGDISEIAIVFSYIVYSVLYIRALQIPLSKNRVLQYLVPLLALCGAGIIVVGSLFINPINVLLFFLFCGIWCGLGYCLQSKN